MANLFRLRSSNQMRTMLVSLVFLTAAPVLAYADFFGKSDKAIVEADGSVSYVAPNWRIVCLGEGKDVFSGPTTRRHCRIEKTDFRAIAVMTSEGLSIPYRPSRPTCGSYPGRMRVDGKPIGKLPLKAKIAAMSHGITFSRPYQTQSPKCQRFTEFTGLYRFSAALSRLKAQWREFK